MTVTHVTTDQERWDAFVIANGGNFLQSWAWSQFQEALGRRTFRYRIGEDGSSTAAQFVLIVLALPLGQRYAYAPRGPIVALGGGTETVRDHVASVTAALRETLRRDGLAFARVEWPWPTEAAVTDAIAPAGFGFVPAPPMQPSHTSVVALTQTEAALLAAMHQKTRYNIKVAEKHGVTVRPARFEAGAVAADDVAAFWALLAETAERDKFHTHERAYYEKMLAVLGSETAAASGAAVRLQFAEREGAVIAAALLVDFGGTVTYLHGASRAADRKFMAPHLLHWTIIKEAKAAGFAAYDLWGTAPNDDPDHPWAGITRFKVGFGGRDVSYLGAWELPGNAFWYGVYRAAKKLRGK